MLGSLKFVPPALSRNEAVSELRRKVRLGGCYGG